ncbi:MAG: phosphotransferase [Gemmataceae bacterium]
MPPNPLPVVARYGARAAGLTWAPVGGGFSGAGVWRGAEPGGTPRLALKAWPADFPPPRLAAIHARVALLTHLPYVPRIHATPDGNTVVVAAGRAWDLSSWADGEPERGEPSAARVSSAAAALAAVHAAWRTTDTGPAPAVLRRLGVIANWDANRPVPAGPFGDAVRRALRTLPPFLAAARAALQPWAARPVPLQPCLVDVWPEHVRFSGSAVVGLVDFGAVQPDHVAVDLARLFGGFPGPSRLGDGLAAYRAAGGRCDEPDAFARLLADTGVACAAAAWVARGGPPAAAPRLHALLDRLSP